MRKTVRRFDPRTAIGVLLLGCFLSFYMVGLFIIPVGAWMLAHSGRS